MTEIFPIELHAYEAPRYTSSPHQYRQAFLAAFRADPKRPRGWFAYDVTIHSRTEVSFVAYSMRDNLSGGIGDVCWRGKATVAPDATREDVDRAILRAAFERRAAELAEEEARIIDGYADEIRAELDRVPA